MEKNYKIEKLKYQENKLAYNVALIAFLINQVYLVQALDNVRIDYHVGIEIFINLTIYLFLFLGIERMKNHHKNWSILLIIMGSSFFLRIFYMPMRILDEAKELIRIGDANGLAVADDLNKAAAITIVSLIVAGLLIMFSGIHGYKQSVTIKNYYESFKLD